MKGEFKTIIGHPNHEISREGVIRNIKTGHIKSQYIGSTGYYMSSFSVENKSKPRRVHRLLATAFIENPSNLPEVNHINGIKTDNRLENLEWVTHEGNMKHAFKTGLANNTGAKNGQSKLTEEKVREIKYLISTGMSQYQIAERIGGISRSCVLGIKMGRLWKHV